MLALISCVLFSTESVALVVTNNKSLSLGRPELRYADDDGVQYVTLFRERLGADNVHLLADLDRDSRRLYPQIESLPPSREAVLATAKKLSQQLARARSEGKRTEAYVVFAGHGDTERGEGFIELQDGRFTATELEALLTELAPVGQAATAHVILDSCNSYFMLNPRKPGGERFASGPTVSNGFFMRHPNIGAIISTSAEAETFEWSELQSGIFSYVLRSGLRGAADANGDSTLSYRELEAFSAIATESIVNEKFRPRIFARAPQQDRATAFWALPTDPQLPRIKKISGVARRVTVRDFQGVRLLDLNADASTALSVVLPKAPEPHEVDERHTRYTLATGKTLVLGEDVGVPSDTPIAGRGESRVFEALFSGPFSAEAVEQYDAQRKKQPETFGLSEREMDRFRLTLQTFADAANADKKRDAYMMFAIGGASLAGGVATGVVAGLSPAGSVQQHVTAIFSGAFGAMALTGGIVGAVLVARPTYEQKLFDKLIAASADDRPRATLEAESELAAHVARIGESRKRNAVLRIVAGGLALGVGAMAVGFVGSDGVTGQPWWYMIGAGALASGAASLTTGILSLKFLREPTERLWDIYQANGSLTEQQIRAEEKKPIKEVWVAPNGLGLAGGFKF